MIYILQNILKLSIYSRYIFDIFVAGRVHTGYERHMCEHKNTVMCHNHIWGHCIHTRTSSGVSLSRVCVCVSACSRVRRERNVCERCMLLLLCCLLDNEHVRAKFPCSRTPPKPKSILYYTGRYTIVCVCGWLAETRCGVRSLCKRVCVCACSKTYEPHGHNNVYILR